MASDVTLAGKVPTNEAAELIGVHWSRLQHYVREGMIKNEKHGRNVYYDLDDIDVLIVHLKENGLGPWHPRSAQFKGGKAKPKVDRRAAAKKAKKKRTKLLTTKQAVKLVGYAPSTICNWAADGEIKSKGKGPAGARMWDRDELLKFVETIKDEPMRGKRPGRSKAAKKRKNKGKRRKPQAVNPKPFGDGLLANGKDGGVSFHMTRAAQLVSMWKQKHKIKIVQEAEWDLIQGVYKIIAGAP